MGKSKSSNAKLITTIVILSALYITMLIGIDIRDSRKDYLPYLPGLYLVTFLVLLYFHRGWNINFLLFILITLLGIFLIQFLNVKTGLVYGKIKYGNVLGLKILGVPIASTLNRFVFIYCIGILVKRMKINQDILSSLVGAALIVLINLLAEPVATALKLRVWTEDMSFLQNYGLRFITAFIFLYLFNLMNISGRNKIALSVLFTEILFLVILNMILI